MLTFVYFVLILGLIVLVHEFGHFIFAKAFGVYVDEFAIGMGPKLFSYKKEGGETLYTVRLIPIGGFCALAGEGSEFDKKIANDRKLQSKSVFQRFCIMFFGAGFNFILAVILLFLLGAIWGAPTTVPKITKVIDGLPAYQGGLKENDIITKVNDKKTPTIDDVSMRLYLSDKSKDIKVEVLRNNNKEILYIKAVKGENEYRIGIEMKSTIRHSFSSIIDYTIVKTKGLFNQMVITLGGLFNGAISTKELSGPIGIFNIVDSESKSGISNLIYLTALLSINVGFINLLPFPAFDGGRILFLLIEKIKGSPVKASTENFIHSIGFTLLMLLMLYVTFNDILKLF